MAPLPESEIRFRIAYLENGIRILSARNLEVAQSMITSLTNLRPEATPLGIYQQGDDGLRFASEYADKLNPDSLAALLSQLKSSYYYYD